MKVNMHTPLWGCMRTVPDPQINAKYARHVRKVSWLAGELRAVG